MGPKKVGQGTYGCVYKPSLSCVDGSFDSSDQYVSKLMNYSRAEDEENVMTRVDEIDPNDVFHYPIVKFCQSGFKPKVCTSCDEDDEECFATCCNVKYTNTLLIYEDGGHDLTRYIQTNLSQPKNINNLPSFYLGLWRLFFGLFVMHNNDYYHLDIKPDNIIVKETSDSYDIRYIDFGIAKNVTDLDMGIPEGDTDVIFENYIYQPQQAKLLRSDIIRFFSDLHKTRQDLATKQARMKGTLHRFLDRGLTEKTKLGEFFPKLKGYYDNMSNDDYVKNVDEDIDMFMSIDRRFFIRPIYTRIDVYMLGFCLKALIADIRDSNPRGRDLEFTNRLDDLANDMNAMNISKRIGPRKAFTRYIKMAGNIYGVNMTPKYHEAVKLIPPERQRLFDASLRRRRNRRLRK